MVAVWTGFAGYMTTKISPLTKEEDFLPPDHAVRRGGVIINKFVRSTTAKTDVKFFWGVQDLSDKGVNPWDSSDIGVLQLD